MHSSRSGFSLTVASRRATDSARLSSPKSASAHHNLPLRINSPCHSLQAPSSPLFRLVPTSKIRRGGLRVVTQSSDAPRRFVNSGPFRPWRRSRRRKIGPHPRLLLPHQAETRKFFVEARNRPSTSRPTSVPPSSSADMPESFFEEMTSSAPDCNYSSANFGRHICHDHAWLRKHNCRSKVESKPMLAKYCNQKCSWKV